MEEFVIIDNTETAGVWTIFDNANQEPISDHRDYKSALEGRAEAYRRKGARIS